MSFMDQLAKVPIQEYTRQHDIATRKWSLAYLLDLARERGRNDLADWALATVRDSFSVETGRVCVVFELRWHLLNLDYYVNGDLLRSALGQPTAFIKGVAVAV